MYPKKLIYLIGIGEFGGKRDHLVATFDGGSLFDQLFLFGTFIVLLRDGVRLDGFSDSLFTKHPGIGRNLFFEF